MTEQFPGNDVVGTGSGVRKCACLLEVCLLIVTHIGATSKEGNTEACAMLKFNAMLTSVQTPELR